jgi:ribosomal protein S18 acetylase RimI-like enzyme
MIEIRRIKKSEVDHFKRIRLRSLRESPESFAASYEDALLRDDESWINQVNKCCSGANRATFLCFDNESLVGITSLYRHEQQTVVGELLQVWVQPEYRKKGLASCLLSESLKWGKNNGFSEVLATVSNTNYGVIKFYELHGFRCIVNPKQDNQDVLLSICI